MVVFFLLVVCGGVLCGGVFSGGVFVVFFFCGGVFAAFFFVVVSLCFCCGVFVVV